MKRIYKGNDIVFNLAINNFPFNIDIIDNIEFKFYTVNPANCITKNKMDIKDASILLNWGELSILEQGVMYYDYSLSIADAGAQDGTLDIVKKQMTNYYIMTEKESIDVEVKTINWGNIQGDIEKQNDLINLINLKIKNIDLSKYYTQDEANNLLAAKAEKVHTHEEYLTEHQSLANYPTKSEMNAAIDKITAGEIDLQNYYDKNTIDGKLLGKVDDAEISDMLTKTEATATYQKKGNYLTEHQSLSDYYTQGQVNNLLAEKAPKVHKHSEYLTEHQSLAEYPTKTEMNAAIDKKVTGSTADLSNYYDKVTVDSKLSTKVDKSVYDEEKKGFALKSEIPSTTNAATKEWVNQQNFLKEVPSEYVTDSELSAKGYLTSHQSLSNYYQKSETYSQAEINDRLKNVTTDGVKRVNLTQSEYDQLSVKDDNTLYYITDAQPIDVVTHSELNAKGYLTEHQDISGKLDAEVYNQEKVNFALKSDIKGGNGNVYDLTKFYDRAKAGNSTITVEEYNEVAERFFAKDTFLVRLKLESDFASNLSQEEQEKYRPLVVMTSVNDDLAISKGMRFIGNSEKKHIELQFKSLPINTISLTEDAITKIPTKVSELENDSNYLTSAAIDGKLDKSVYDEEKKEFALKSDIKGNESEIYDLTPLYTRIKSAGEGALSDTEFKEIQAAIIAHKILVCKVDGNNQMDRSNYIYFTSASDGNAMPPSFRLLASDNLNDYMFWVDQYNGNNSARITVKEKAVIPTKTSELQNDSNYLTSHQDISMKADITYVDNLIGGVEEKITEINNLI